MEYHPEWEDDYKPPMPKVKKVKDHRAEENAILEIMTLAIYGAAAKAIQDGSDLYEANRKVFELFKDAKFIE